MKRALRPRAHQSLAACGLGVAVLTLEAPACLDDLPPAKVCPPAAVHPAGDCTPLFNAASPNCLSDRPETAALESCLSGPRASCACAEDECPTAASDCYPEGDCPPEVVDVAGPEARCIRFAPEDFGVGVVSDATQCMCGCARCASVCDGQGPVIGVLADTSPLYAAPVMDLRKYMPDAGRIGVYIRARGVSNLGIGVLTGDYVNDPGHLESRSFYFMATPLGDFTEQVFYGPDFVGHKEPYAWSTEEGKPTTLILVNSQPMPPTKTVLTFYELDCIIPFVVP